MTAEESLAGLLLEDPRRVAQIEGRLSSEWISDPQARQAVDWLLKRGQEGDLPGDHRAFLNGLPPEAGEFKSRVARWLAWAEIVEEKEKALEEILVQIQKQRRRVSLESLRASILQAEEARDESTAARLILEYSRLVRADLAEVTGS